MEAESLGAEPAEEGGREERDAMEGLEVGIEGAVRRSVTSEEVLCRCVKTSQSSSASNTRAPSAEDPRGGGGSKPGGEVRTIFQRVVDVAPQVLQSNLGTVPVDGELAGGARADRVDVVGRCGRKR